MSISLFNSADTAHFTEALQRGCSPDQIVSVQFRAEVPPVRFINEQHQWLRLQSILGSKPVYDALGISSLPIDPPAQFHYATGLETIGTLANLLTHGGVHRDFADDHHAALTLSQNFLDRALLSSYSAAEAYSCHTPWCEWFIGEGILDETVLFGSRGDWWLLAVTDTD